MRLLLATPLDESSRDDWRTGKGENSFPYGLACVAAAAEAAGHTVACLDLRQTAMADEDFVRHLVDGQFQVLGLSFMTCDLNRAARTAALAKSACPDLRIVLGGIHPSTQPRQTLALIAGADCCVIGEGDETIVELLAAWQDGAPLDTVRGLALRQGDGIHLTPPRPSIADLNTLPMPAYHLFPMRDYAAPPNTCLQGPAVAFQITRGCPYRCSYCEYTAIGGSKIRHKTVDSIIAEIRHLVEHYGFKSFVFRDSTLTVKVSLVEALCKALLREKINISWSCQSRVDLRNAESLFALMRKAGCWRISFGCESGNEKSLKLMNKTVTIEQMSRTIKAAYKAGICVNTSWMLALPGEDEADVINTIRLSAQLPSHTAVFFLPIPFPGTELETICRQDGGINEPDSPDAYGRFFSADSLIYVNPRIGVKRTQELLATAYRTFYFRPTTILRHLALLRDWRYALSLTRSIGLFLGL